MEHDDKFLTEHGKAWLVTEILNGKVSRQDYLDGKVKYCERCKSWEYNGWLTACMFDDAVNHAINQSGQPYYAIV